MRSWELFKKSPWGCCLYIWGWDWGNQGWWLGRKVRHNVMRERTTWNPHLSLFSNMQTWVACRRSWCPCWCVWPAAHTCGSRPTGGKGGFPAGAGSHVGRPPLRVNLGSQQVNQNTWELQQCRPTPSFGTLKKMVAAFLPFSKTHRIFLLANLMQD